MKCTGQPIFINIEVNVDLRVKSSFCLVIVGAIGFFSRLIFFEFKTAQYRLHTNKIKAFADCKNFFHGVARVFRFDVI